MNDYNTKDRYGNGKVTSKRKVMKTKNQEE